MALSPHLRLLPAALSTTSRYVPLLALALAASAQAQQLGTSYDDAVPNFTGAAASMLAFGSNSAGLPSYFKTEPRSLIAGPLARNYTAVLLDQLFAMRSQLVLASWEGAS